MKMIDIIDNQGRVDCRLLKFSDMGQFVWTKGMVSLVNIIVRRG